MNWIFAELWGAVKPYIKKFISRLKMYIKLKKVSKELECGILEQFQNEIYFNDLDSFLYDNKVLSNFIINCNSSGIDEYENIEVFINKRVSWFVERYPHYVLQRSEINSALKKLFLMTFNKLNEIENNDLECIASILNEHITSLKNSISKVEDKINELDKKTNENGKKIIELLEKNLPEENKIVIKSLFSTLITPFVPPEIDFQQLIQRNDLTNKIIENLNFSNWIHIVGSAWSGKTSVALLVKNKLNDSCWIDFSLGNSISIIKAFESILSDANASKNVSYVIIDNLPELNISDPFATIFSSFIKNLKQKQLKIISFGMKSIPTLFSSSEGELKILDLPEFTKEDVIELMRKVEAPEKITEDKTSELILELAGKKPAAIVIILQFLKSTKWDLNSEIFSKILTLDIEELTHQINNVLTATIKDEKSRELLYRISVIGHPITQSELKEIAAIEPRIDLVGERIRNLKNIWISGDKMLIANGVIRNFSKDNIDESVRIAINDKMANSIIKKYTLDQLDITRLITHLICANRIDEAGDIYILAMKSLCEENIKYNDSFFFVKMWHDVPLPSEMNVMTQATIRVLQIWYDIYNEIETDYLVSELIKLSNQNDMIRQIVLAAGGILITKNRKIAMELIHSVSYNGLPEKIECLQDEVVFPIESIVVLMFYSITDLQEMKDWLYYVKNKVPNSIIEKLKGKEYSQFFIHGTEKTRVKLHQDYEESFGKIVQEIYDYAVGFSWTSLCLGCSITLIQLQKNKVSQSSVKSLYDKYFTIVSSDEYYASHFNLWIGVVAIGQKEFGFAIELLSKASLHHENLNEMDRIICYMNCAIGFSNSSMTRESVLAIDQALNVTSTPKECFTSELIFKIHFERFICYYLNGTLYSALDSIDYMNQYLANNKVQGNEHFISILSHSIAYIQADLLNHDPPQMLNEHEVYVKPYVGMLWNFESSDKFKMIDNKSRKTMISIYSAKLFDFYGEKEKCNGCLDNCINDIQNLDNKTLGSVLTIDSFITSKLFEKDVLGLCLPKLFDYISTIDNELNLMRMILIKLTFIVLSKNNLSKKIIAVFRNYKMPIVCENIWNEWLDNLELANEFFDYSSLVEKGNELLKQNNAFGQMNYYIFATSKANLVQLIDLYCTILNSAPAILNDIYWINRILVPMMKEQFSKLCDQNLSLKSLMNSSLNPLNEYHFDEKGIKLFIKQCVSISGYNMFKREHIQWLNN